MKPLSIVEKDETGRFLELFISMGRVGEVDFEVASEFVCRMYGQTKETNVDEARYSKLLQMSGKVDKVSRHSLDFVLAMNAAVVILLIWSYTFPHILQKRF